MKHNTNPATVAGPGTTPATNKNPAPADASRGWEFADGLNADESISIAADGVRIPAALPVEIRPAGLARDKETGGLYVLADVFFESGESVMMMRRVPDAATARALFGV